MQSIAPFRLFSTVVVSARFCNLGLEKLLISWALYTNTPLSLQDKSTNKYYNFRHIFIGTKVIGQNNFDLRIISFVKSFKYNEDEDPYADD